MPKLTAKEAQVKHNARLKASLEDIRKGIDRVTESPTEKAAAKQEKMKAKLVASIDSGKWAENLKAVSLAEWKDKFKTKGVDRISRGIDEAAPKMEAFYSRLFPHIEAGQQAVKGLPDLTLEDSITRMTTFVRHMSKFKNTRS